jgi:hypothetical protein
MSLLRPKIHVKRPGSRTIAAFHGNKPLGGSAEQGAIG